MLLRSFEDMPEEFKYTINVLGEPMGKQRPRATSFGGHTRIYTPSKTLSYEARFAHEFKEKYPEAKPLTGPIAVEVMAWFGLKKADYNSKGQPNKHGLAKLGGEELPTKKPDLDNVLKAVLDGLNGIAFVDDSQVVNVCMAKHYDLTPRVAVTVRACRCFYPYEERKPPLTVPVYPSRLP